MVNTIIRALFFLYILHYYFAKLQSFESVCIICPEVAPFSRATDSRSNFRKYPERNNKEIIIPVVTHVKCLIAKLQYFDNSLHVILFWRVIYSETYLLFDNMAIAVNFEPIYELQSFKCLWNNKNNKTTLSWVILKGLSINEKVVWCRGTWFCDKST